MRITKTAAALFALLALSGGASALAAQAQTSDRSGAITLQFQVAKFVEVVSDAPSTHNLTADLPDGLTPGVGSIDTPDGMVTREIRANTPYRLSVVGLTASGELDFSGGTSQVPGQLTLQLQCRFSAAEMPSSPSEYAEWACPNSGPMVPTASSWVTLRAYSETPSFTENVRAGTYQATVYLQIEAL